MSRFTAGLSPIQITAVLTMFVLTLSGAIGLALMFRWWNGRKGCRFAGE